MNCKSLYRPIIAMLLALALLLPVAQGVLFWVGQLLGAMGDSAGQAFVARIVLTLAILWLLDLVALILALAAHSLDSTNEQ